MTQTDCLFCKIIDGAIPCKKIRETENFFSFHDVSPQAEVHALVIPKKHVSDILNATEELSPLILGEYLCEVSAVAEELGLSEGGFRTVFNTKADACQTVFHIHAHVIGGCQLDGKMG